MPHGTLKLILFSFFSAFLFTHCELELVKTGKTEQMADELFKTALNRARQEELNSLFSNEEGRKIAQEIAKELLKSGVEGGAEGLKNKLPEMTDLLFKTTIKAFKEQGLPLVAEITPDVEKMLKRMIANSILTAGSAIKKSAKNDLAMATRILITAATDAFLESLQKIFQGLDDKAVLVINQKLTPAFGNLAHQMSKETILGLQEAVKESKWLEKLPPFKPVTQEFGVWLGEGIGEGLVRSVAKDPMKPVLMIVCISLGSLLLLQLLIFILVVRKYLQAKKSLTLFANQLHRYSYLPKELQKDPLELVKQAHQAAQQEKWFAHFLKQQGLSPSNSSETSV